MPVQRRANAQPRCSCGCFLQKISEDNYTCCNERCPESWQAAKRDFDSSLLGAACRQLVSVERS